MGVKMIQVNEEAIYVGKPTNIISYGEKVLIIGYSANSFAEGNQHYYTVAKRSGEECRVTVIDLITVAEFESMQQIANVESSPSERYLIVDDIDFHSDYVEHSQSLGRVKRHLIKRLQPYQDEAIKRLRFSSKPTAFITNKDLNFLTFPSAVCDFSNLERRVMAYCKNDVKMTLQGVKIMKQDWKFKTPDIPAVNLNEIAETLTVHQQVAYITFNDVKEKKFEDIGSVVFLHARLVNKAKQLNLNIPTPRVECPCGNFAFLLESQKNLSVIVEWARQVELTPWREISTEYEVEVCYPDMSSVRWNKPHVKPLLYGDKGKTPPKKEAVVPDPPEKEDLCEPDPKSEAKAEFPTRKRKPIRRK